MRKVLWLDDIRNPLDYTFLFPKDCTLEWVKNGEEFIGSIKKEIPDIIFLDHDLGTDSMDGYDCIKWLCNYLLDENLVEHVPEIFSQSMNPVGKENILNYYKNFKQWMDSQS